MANTSLKIGGNNWAVKEDNLLGYNVIQNKYVPIEMDTVRATTATRVNENGLIEVVPKNLASYSEQFDNANWIKNNAVVTANSTISPNGSLTADKIIPSAVLDYHYLRLASAPINLISGVSVATYSIYAKQGEYYNFRLGTSASAGNGATFNLSNGTISNNTAISASIEDVGNGWYRCIVRGLVGSVLDSLILNNLGVDTFEGNAVNGLFLWGAQIEANSTATSYFPTTDRLNIPRIDYSSGEASLLVEGQRTNLVTYSNDFTNSIWTKVNASISSNSVTSPDGTQNASKLVEDTANSSHYFRNDFTLVNSGSSYTYSIFAKKAERNFILLFDSYINSGFWFNLDSGIVGSKYGTGAVTANIQNFGNNWYKCSITFTSHSGGYALLFNNVTNADNVISYTGNGTSGVYLWGAQLEAGSYATSYIPTVASAVTRNADVISKTGISDLIGQTEGTVFIEFKDDGEASSFTNYLRIDDGTTNNNISVYKNNSLSSLGAAVTTSGVLQCNLINSVGNLKNITKVAFSYKLNSFSVSVNGSAILKDTLGTVPLLLSRIKIGGDSVNSIPTILSGKVNLVKLYKTALTDSELISLTTL